MITRANSAPRAAGEPGAAGSTVRRPAVASRFGAISPAFADAFGASVDLALSFGSRNAAARALSTSARFSRGSAHLGPLPTRIPPARDLPPSRVGTAVNLAPRR